MTDPRQMPDTPQAIVAAARAEIDRVVERARRNLTALTDAPSKTSTDRIESAAEHLDELRRDAEAQLTEIAESRNRPRTEAARFANGPAASAEASAALRRELAVWEEERRPLPTPSHARTLPVRRGSPWAPAVSEAAPPEKRRAGFVAVLVLLAAIGAATALWFSRSLPSKQTYTASTAPTPVAENVPVPTAPPVEISSAPPAAPLVVRWETQRPSWIQTTVDGTTDNGALYEAGESRTIEAENEIRLRVGDAGAVVVSVNNQPAVTLGADGQVVNRRFPAELNLTNR